MLVVSKLELRPGVSVISVLDLLLVPVQYRYQRYLIYVTISCTFYLTCLTTSHYSTVLLSGHDISLVLRLGPPIQMDN